MENLLVLTTILNDIDVNKLYIKNKNKNKNKNKRNEWRRRSSWFLWYWGSLKDLSHHLAFMDLKKACNLVPIYNGINENSLYWGIRGKCYNFIENLFLSSKAM